MNRTVWVGFVLLALAGCESPQQIMGKSTEVVICAVDGTGCFAAEGKR